MRRLVLRKRERIAIVRRRLNEEMHHHLGVDDPDGLRRFAVELIDILDGNEDRLSAHERNVIKDARAEWLRLRR